MKSNIKLFLILITALSMTATSCLKDKDYDDGVIQSVRSTGSIKPIEIKLTAASTENFLTVAVDNSDNDTTIDFIPVNLATAAPAPEDIHVTLVRNDELITAYNDANGTEYVTPDPSLYTIVNEGNVVTIPKGSNTGYLQIKFVPSNYLVGAWAFAFTIQSIDKPGYTISGNMKDGIAALGAKNIYDGHYKSQGTFMHPSLGSSWTYDQGVTQDFITSGPNSVTTTSLSTLAATFGVVLDITVNPDNSLDEVLNGVPTATPNNDHYDPATKTFYVTGSYSGGTRKLDASYEYVGPR